MGFIASEHMGSEGDDDSSAGPIFGADADGEEAVPFGVASAAVMGKWREEADARMTAIGDVITESQRREGRRRGLEQRNVEEELGEREERIAEREAAQAEREAAAAARVSAAEQRVADQKQATDRFRWQMVGAGVGALLSAAAVTFGALAYFAPKEQPPIIVQPPAVTVVAPPPAPSGGESPR